MRTSRNSKLIILHLVTYLLFLLPVGKLDLFKENYSTLSLNTKGYFFLFGLGILCGLVLGYDSYKITRDKRWGIAVFLGLFLGTCIPHEVPYHLRGNLHLFFAYTGGFVLIVSTINNLFKKGNLRLRNILMMNLLACLLLYMRYMMVNTLIEVIIMSSCLFIDLILLKEFKIRKLKSHFSRSFPFLYK